MCCSAGLSTTGFRSVHSHLETYSAWRVFLCWAWWTPTNRPAILCRGALWALPSATRAERGRGSGAGPATRGHAARVLPLSQTPAEAAETIDRKKGWRSSLQSFLTEAEESSKGRQTQKNNWESLGGHLTWLGSTATDELPLFLVAPQGSEASRSGPVSVEWCLTP